MTKQKFIKQTHKAVHAVHAASVALLLIATGAAMLVAYVVSPLWLLPVAASPGAGVFHDSAVWARRLPAYPALADNSALHSQEIARQAAVYGTIVDAQNLGTPVYEADIATPLRQVQLKSCDGISRPDLTTAWQAVPIPFYLQPNANGRAVIYQTATDTMWEFWGMYELAGQWQACGGGVMPGASAKQGAWPSPYGVTDSGLVLLGGQVSIADYRAGRINHAIGLTIPQVGSLLSWPATQGAGANVAAPGYGVRLQLDPALDVNSMGLSRFGRMVAKAAQEYGFIVWDSGPQVAVSVESPLSYTNRGAPDPFGGQLAATDLNNFPWAQLRVMPQDFGLTGHLPSILDFSASSAQVSAGDIVQLEWRSQNVDQCAIAGVITGAPAVGAAAVNPGAASSYTVQCSGPMGSVQRSVGIAVRDHPADLPYIPDAEIRITTNLAGQFSALADLYAAPRFEQIYKVMYYDQADWLQTTTEPGFALDTTKLPDGEQAVKARIFFRDGTQDTQILRIAVQNVPERLALPHPLSYETTPRVNTGLMLVGIVLSLAVGGLAGWLGWRKSVV